MEKSRIRKTSIWREGLAINLASNFIGFLVGALVAYFEHEGSKWVSPLLLGSMAWLLTMAIWLIARLLNNIPVRQLRITDNNLHAVLRDWLNNIGVKVQSTKEERTDFMFIVTTDGGWVISIIRHQESFPEYLTFRAFYKDETQGTAFSHFTNEQKAEARLTIQLELTRAVMGYISKDILDGFTLFKRIPITSSLSIEDVSRTLWEIEAALASVFYAGAILLAKNKSSKLLSANIIPDQE